MDDEAGGRSEKAQNMEGLVGEPPADRGVAEEVISAASPHAESTEVSAVIQPEVDVAEQITQHPPVTPGTVVPPVPLEPGHEILSIGTHHTKIEPIKRGGRPRTTEGCEQNPVDRPVSERNRKPELICFESAREWVLAAELPEETDTEGVTALQQDQPLERDERNEHCWRLAQACGLLEFKWPDGTELTLQLGEHHSECLLFKLSGRGHKRGRQVRRASCGAFLFIAPENWKRIGFESFPEPVSVAGYSAHYIVMDAHQEPVSFFTGTDAPAVIPVGAAEFELVGDAKVNTCDGLGPLFAGQSPAIRAQKIEQWQQVSTIVIGQEGSGRGRWRAEFTPDAGVTDQSLPSEITQSAGGWYFARIYDVQKSLIDSLDFRYLRDLARVQVDDIPSVPPPCGHTTVVVNFEHRPGFRIEPVGKTAYLSLEHYESATLATIPANPSFDETQWAVPVTATRKIEFSLLLERVWWSLDDGDATKSQSDWTDKSLEVRKEDFAPTSSKVLRIWFPRPGWTAEAWVGCVSGRLRRYAVAPTTRSISVPLRDFSDSPELHATRFQFRLCLRKDDFDSGTLLLYMVQQRQPEQTPLFPTPVPIRQPERRRGSCINCDQARTRLGFVRCRRHHWQPILYQVFLRIHAADSCPEWVGEPSDEEPIT